MHVSPESQHHLRRRLGSCCAIFAVVMGLLCCAGIAWGGRVGLSGEVVALAVAVCGVAGLLALGTTWFFQTIGNPVAGVLGGSLFRVLVPLGAGVMLTATFPSLREGGFFPMLLAMFFFTLVVETSLSVWMISGTLARGTDSVSGIAHLPAGSSKLV